MSTVKRWKIKEHYVAGEFAGYVVVTDDKHEDVVCHGIGVDYRDDAVLIASAPALEAERDRLREALRKIAEMEAGSHEPSFEMRDCMTSESCMNCDEMINIAREALEGAEDVEKDS